MFEPVPLFCLWVVVAGVIGMAPTRYHWRGAYVLIATGVPLLIWLALDQPIWVTLLALLAVASVLRWPLRYIWRRMTARLSAGSK
jgi:hypothetical protein